MHPIASSSSSLPLCDLANAKDLSQFELWKLKSHQKDAEVTCEVALDTVLGNRFADQLAGLGTQEDRSPIHEIAQVVANWFLRQREARLAFRPFAIACDILRLAGFANKPQEDTTKDKKFTIQQLEN